MDEETKKFIREHFEIVVENPDKTYNPESYALHVTHNGRQWTTIGFTNKDEIKQLIKVLQDAVSDVQGYRK